MNEIETAVAESIATDAIVRVTVSGSDIIQVVSGLSIMDGIEDVDYSREDDGSWDVYGTTDAGESFRLRVTCA